MALDLSLGDSLNTEAEEEEEMATALNRLNTVQRRKILNELIFFFFFLIDESILHVLDKCCYKQHENRKPHSK